GRFELRAQAGIAGRALFELRVLDRDDGVVETVPVPLVAREGDALRVLLLAGAPDPEFKYLRRWATDAGVDLTSRAALSNGNAMTEGAAKIDASSHADKDVVMVDERSWAALEATGKANVIAAVRDGLGLLPRVTGTPPADVATDWSDRFGIILVAGDETRDV